MNRKLIVFFIFVPSIFFLSGCWDSAEVNDRAFILAWGIDKAKDKKILISTQVITPSKISGGQGDGGGSQGKSYFVATGMGKNTIDAAEQMQTKLSRQIFRGQRRIIVIGEQLARQGLKDILDTYSRDPRVNILSDIFVIKEGTAKDFLKTSYPLENIPAIGAVKEYNQIGAPQKVSFLNLLLSATSEGIYPTMPAIVFGPPSSTEEENREVQSNAKGFRIGGVGIFNKDLKLIGFLNADEAKVLGWVTQKRDKLVITAFVPQKKGSISLDMNKMDSKIQPIIQRNKIKILITLTGRGAIRENNTGLDLTQLKNITLVQNTLDKQVEKTVLKTITKVQKKYRADIFGFGNAIQRKDSHQWKSLKKNWDKEFPEAEISVKANLTVRRIGVTGRSLIK